MLTGIKNTSKNIFIDCHTHTFIMKHVPSDFLPFNLYWILNSLFCYNIIRTVGKFIIPIRGDVLDRGIKFAKFSRTGNQHRVFEKFINDNPKVDSFVVLAMDFDYMGFKKAPEISYIEQLLELKKLKEIYGDKIQPFVMADPRRPDVLKLVKQAIEEWGFTGVKMYPPLGYTISDFSPEFLKYMEDNQVPIITHCSTNCATYYRGDDINKVIGKSCHYPSEFLKYQDKSNREKTDLFSFPLEYSIVLEKYPNLKLDLAHFGGNDQWKDRMDGKPYVWSDYIIQLCTKYPNVYTDLSYVMSDKSRHGELVKLLKTNPHMRNKILYGTDWYLVSLDEYNITDFALQLRTNIGEESFNEILINNVNFLKFKK